ncbi:porin [Phocoenobacter skyensis]|uniref:Long-chain fatty acid transport protein n=1 Tax=Phocoenobacter skyensis TaxID=97481 RepID=A0A1H7ZCA2_9PAST|nr:outer membrane protein transport protein [Pasteurella skyensis]MDP8080198.1 outer membrane protein transport protein [Pasteurella skyensis]MDP8086180.1 outer membrane protein transport protein [Pasteurella skyensis]MDP8174316.1 outer membrane protein transport protein [Pasteurella skyensis]QLB23012.1 hypothetical protein A6B44_07285 [Pasteurella skyensis]SEM56040.1 long-chain fatty acid transport protein [Pasteurella skyensis]
MKKMVKLSLASMLTLSATGSLAAGFQLVEISTSGLGVAYAGNAAVADNASVVATNPALMTQFKGSEISVGGVYVDVDVDVSGTQTITTPMGAMSEDASHNNIVPVATLPNLYFVMPINDRFSIGGGMNLNYGLKTSFGENYSAGVLGGTTDLRAVNYNFSGAMKLDYGFSVGLGLNAVHSTAELTRYAGSFSQLINQQAGANIANNSTKVKHLKGEEWTFAWNAGVSYDINENHRIGLAYHSAVDIGFKGDFSSELPILAGGTGGQDIAGSLDLTLPAFWELSGYHKLTDKLALQYSWKRTDWSSFKELRAVSNTGAELLQKTEKFSDSDRYAIGISYQAMDKLTLRAGLAYDEGASQEHPSISIPDTDRTWYSLGATYQFTPNLSTDFGYSYIHGHKNRFVENENISGVPVSWKGEGHSHVNLWGLNVNYKF